MVNSVYLRAFLILTDAELSRSLDRRLLGPFMRKVEITGESH